MRHKILLYRCHLLYCVLAILGVAVLSEQANITTNPTESDTKDTLNTEYESSGGDYEYTDTNATIDDEDDDYEDDEEINKEWEGFNGFECSDGTKLAKNKVCNGAIDCHDCSDEYNCRNAAENIFLCYDKDELRADYSSSNPKCINIKKFCDGVADCIDGADEARSGPGFKCQVKDKFRKCKLPERLVCDTVVHCEDESDACEYDGKIAASSNRSSKIDSKYSRTPTGLFRCLNNELLISQNQVCDGEFDCTDLSDECMCEIQKTQIVHDVCNGMCTRKLWRDQKENMNCVACNLGEIYWEPRLKRDSGITTKSCFSTVEIMNILQKENDQLGLLSDKISGYDVIECFDQSLTGMIRARKCDGRPECLFGRDECGIDCLGGGSKEWIGSGFSDGADPEFCKLLSVDVTGYNCLSELNANRTPNDNMTQIEKMLNSRRIHVCDGNIECDDESDEAFCPTRLSCTPETNETAFETYDISQQCDGFSHCHNGEDEHHINCATSPTSRLLSCDVANGKQEWFHSNTLLDGKSDCVTGVDECPPYFSKLEGIKVKYYEGMNGKQIVRSRQSGISSHDRAIDNLPLQVFLIAAAFIGLSALTVSLVLAFYNLTVAWMKSSDLDVKDADIWTRNGLICIREVVVNLSITIAKGFVCGYFAYIKITRTEDSNYSILDLRWRLSTPCSVAGTIVLIGTQVPIFSLAGFAGFYVLFRACKKRERSSFTLSRTEEIGQEHDVSIACEAVNTSTKGSICAKPLIAICCIILIAVTWLPVVVFAGFLTFPSMLNAQTRTYAWVRASSAPSLFRANLLDRDAAEKFASAVVTIKNQTLTLEDLSSTSYFTFSEFAKIVDYAAPLLGIHMRGSYGYFAQSGTCLPSFLVHVNGGEAPFDIAVSNSWTWGISIAILIFDLVLILATTAMTTRYAASVLRYSCCRPLYSPPVQKSRKILNNTFSLLVLIEVLTWLFIISLFFLKAAVPDCLSDYTYTICCLSVLGLNCGVVSPFVLLRRKFHLRRKKNSVVTKRRPRSFNDSNRIVEEDEDAEEITENEPLTKRKSESSAEQTENDECQNLVYEENCTKTLE